jgi:hypothetical protein
MTSLRTLVLCALVLLAVVSAAPRAATAPILQVPSAHGDVRFETRDVVIDPRGATLAAWQVRLVDPSGRVRIVGVEGGENAVFAAPPHHDPRALSHGAIVLAAYDTTDAGPTTSSRVARVHLAVTGAADVAFEVTLEVAASPAGPIPGATCTLIR